MEKELINEEINANNTSNNPVNTVNPVNSINSVKQNQIHDLLFSREIGWQEIIYDLINTEQLDPWDINIIILTEKFLAKIQELDEADFFVSSKVLLAAALLLRIKSEILLNKYIKSIDDILFGKKEQEAHVLERIELEDEIPELIPKSPIPRFKKVTLQELMESLEKAIKTENRRIRKEIISRNALREAGITLPKKSLNIRDRIKEIYNKLFKHFNENSHKLKVSYSDFIGMNKEQRIISFSPLLHLEDQKKIWLDQEQHFDEIHIWLHKTYIKHKGDPFADLKQEIEKEIEKTKTKTDKKSEKTLKKDKPDKETKKRLKKIEKEFSEPLG